VTSIVYTTGDATHPDGDGPRLIVHVCNDAGGWGAGFSGVLSRRWPEPEREYRARARGRGAHLGLVQFVPVEADITVVNMVAQHGIGPDRHGTPPIRYDILRVCLAMVAAVALDPPVTPVHMPRIGCGLAGGRWDTVEKIIEQVLCGVGVPVTVYDLPPVS
jgi:O-acetyl-ADP-ribose deacetylase (regulator of RNase III)